MLQKPDSGAQTAMAAQRIVPLDRARTFITLLVVLHHSVINYTYFGNADRMRWLGFDLVVLFNDSFFMACMFFISGLFVRHSLARSGPTEFLANRARRLGVPFLVSVFVVMPDAYYPTFLRYHLPGTADFNFFHFWWHTLTIGPWPSGSAWFLWVLLTLDAIAALLWAAAPRMIEALGQLIYAPRDRPMTAFVAFLIFSITVYLPMRLIFGDSAWLVPGHYPLPIQTSRILLYAGYFFTGVGVGAVNLRTGMLAENGALTKCWTVWLAFALAFYGAILLLVYAHHNWLADFNSPPLWWHTAYGLAFAMFSAAMTFTVPAVFQRFARSSLWLLDAMRPSAYGIYLLHFIFLIWLQYIVYDPAFPAFVKFAIVFIGTLSMSWALTVLLRKIPVVARTI
jgi:surface polysaccharide O-acyltransferase-like enzyme